MADNTDEEHLDNLKNTQSEKPPGEIIPIKENETINPNPEIENMEVHKHPHHVTHKKKWGEYLLEFLMLFLAVFLGFVAENLRESNVNKEKEHHYIQSLLTDLQKDTVMAHGIINFQQSIYDHLDTALKIQVRRLTEIPVQDTFFYHIFLPYSLVGIFKQNNSTISQLKTGGFNIFKNKDVVDSISTFYNFYQWVEGNNDFLPTAFLDFAHQAQAILRLPAPAFTLRDSTINIIPKNKEIFMQTDENSIQKLYNVAANYKGSIATAIDVEKMYILLAERLMEFLKKEYGKSEFVEK